MKLGETAFATSVKKNRKRIFTVVIILFVVLLIGGITSFICYKIVHPDENDLFIYKEYAKQIEKRDIVIVPGGAAPDGYPGTQLSRRLDASIFLLDNGYIDKIIISGNKYETNAMKKYLVNHDVSPKIILNDEYSEDTLDTIRRAGAYKPDAKFYISTQEFYSDRTAYIVNHTDIDAKIINSDLIVFQTNIRNQMREYFAATKAVLEVNLFKLPKTKNINEYKIEAINDEKI